MMGGDEEVAGAGIASHEPVECGPFEVTGEEGPPACRFNRHDEARLVVGGGGHRPIRRAWVEHADATERIEGNLVSGRDGPEGDSRGSDPRQDLGDGGGRARQKGLGDNDAADLEAFEDIGNSVEMIGVGMGDDERVDATDPLAPEQRRKPAPRRHTGAKPPGVVHQAASGGTADDQTASMPHRCGDHLEARSRFDRERADEKADGSPHPGRARPCRGANQPRGGDSEQDRHDSDIPPRRPPGRRSGHPMKGSRELRGGIDGQFDPRQSPVAHRPADSRDWPTDRGGEEAEKSPHHRQPDQRRDEGIEDQPGRAEDMEVGSHQRRRRQPDGGTDKEGIGGVAAPPPDRSMDRRA